MCYKPVQVNGNAPKLPSETGARILSAVGTGHSFAVTLAYTPVLTARNIYNAIRQRVAREDRESHAQKKERQDETAANFLATWMNLLKYTTMDQFVRDEFWNQTKQTAADYSVSPIRSSSRPCLYGYPFYCFLRRYGWLRQFDDRAWIPDIHS